jgi:glutathione synthase/RimK-type ligase-like ATP-grasp enzyme
MKQCAFLTLAQPGGFVIDDYLARKPLAGRGWHVRDVPWSQDSTAWSSFDAVVVRSTWDYPSNVPGFLSALERIDASGVPLFNPLALLRWNLAKTYLSTLASRGVPTIPTLIREHLTVRDVPDLFDALGAEEIVVKPVIGANAIGTFRLHRERWWQQAGGLDAYFRGRRALVQPFVKAIPREGECSLVYFDGACSHAVRKTPAPDDFRVQEEHGALIEPLVISEELQAVADVAMGGLGQVPLYARVDLVKANDDAGYWIMELELIEPSLYLRMDLGAPGRCADAFVRQVQACSPTGQADLHASQEGT